MRLDFLKGIVWFSPEETHHGASRISQDLWQGRHRKGVGAEILEGSDSAAATGTGLAVQDKASSCGPMGVTAMAIYQVAESHRSGLPPNSGD